MEQLIEENWELIDERDWIEAVRNKDENLENNFEEYLILLAENWEIEIDGYHEIGKVGLWCLEELQHRGTPEALEVAEALKVYLEKWQKAVALMDEEDI